MEGSDRLEGSVCVNFKSRDANAYTHKDDDHVWGKGPETTETSRDIHVTDEEEGAGFSSIYRERAFLCL